MNLERGLRPEGSDSKGSATFGRRRGAPIGAGWGHLTAAGCVEGGAGKGFRRFKGFRGFKGWWIALWAMLIKSALRDWLLRLLCR